MSDRPEHSQADPSRGRGMGQPGGGGAREVPGGSKGYLGEHRGQSQSYKDPHREQTGIPAKSPQLSNTGFFSRSLADKRRLGQWSIDIA